MIDYNNAVTAFNQWHAHTFTHIHSDRHTNTHTHSRIKC